MQRYSDFIFSNPGRPMAGVNVTVVYQETGELAPLYEDASVESGQVVNPITTDENGGFHFYAPNGRYRLLITGAGLVAKTIEDVILFDSADEIKHDLSLGVGAGVNIEGKRVLGPRVPGWTTPDGASSRFGFNTASATNTQLAQAFRALIEDLKAHGILGGDE